MPTVTREYEAPDTAAKAARQLEAVEEATTDIVGEKLVLNMGPAWIDASAYALFGNNVIEVPFRDWECPPGVGVLPLDVLFTACSTVSG